MAEVSVVSEKLGRLLRASGWSVDSNRFTIYATEPAFEPVARTWMAGRASALSDNEVRSVNPSRIIIEDSASQENILRLVELVDGLRNGATVNTYSRFIDNFWGAREAVEVAVTDANRSELDFLFDAPASGPDSRHVSAHLKIGALSVPDSRALEFGITESGSCMAVLADAGLGKSELLRWHEWRSGVMYRSAFESQKSNSLPSVVLRVPLRDFKSLSLDYVAHNISQPAEAGGRGLNRIISGAMLRELIVQGRLILLLDGLDEMSSDSLTLDAGILEWRSVVRDGGRFVLTSRAGHEASGGTIRQRFHANEIAELSPLGRPSALELLRKRGADDATAAQVIAALSGPSAGIPLFLLLALHVGLDAAPSAEVSKSKTLMLLKLLRLFCERDEERVGISADDQIAILTQIAEWSMESGPLPQDELLNILGIDERDPLARIVRSPHALLSNNEGIIGFKFHEFGALFAAQAIAESWRHYGFGSVESMLRRHQLTELVVESLARLLHPDLITVAWLTTELEAGGTLILRNSLLAVAVARVADVAHEQNANMRAVELAKVLGNRSLVNVNMSGIYMNRFDFADWKIQRVQGHGVLSYCDNLWRADYDDSVSSLITDGCSFEPPATQERQDLSAGIDRLRRLLRPLRRKGGGSIIALMRREEANDVAGWELLVHMGLALPSGKSSHARWTLNAEGLRMLTAFGIADGHGSEELLLFIDSNHDLRMLLKGLTKA